MKTSYASQKGVTLIELIVVVGILSILFTIGVASIMNTRVSTTNNTTTSVIASDIKNQQIEAMTGDTEGRGVPDNYGVKILTNSYVLFHGNSYNPSDPANFTVPTDTGYQLSTTFPDSTVIFASKSGEIVGFVTNQNTITLTYTSTGQAKSIQLNKYGTITSIN